MRTARLSRLGNRLLMLAVTPAAVMALALAAYAAGAHQPGVAGILLISAPVLAVSAFIALALGRQIIHPLERLAGGMDRIRQGDLSAEIETGSFVEIRALGDGFNAMARELKAARERMQREIDQSASEAMQTMEALEIQNVELDLARKRALDASKVKTEFLAHMSHEIRTPMNGIMGFANLLRKTELSPEQREFLSMMSKSAQALLKIINDILDFSKLESGKLTLEHAPFRIRECCEDSVMLFAPAAHAKRLDLVLLIYDDVPEQLIGDSARIRQILVNLIDNAIKFTPAGEVAVRVMLEDETDKDCTLGISVTDTGIGIPEEARQDLFRAFHQASTSITRLYGGTGLGLSICQRLAKSMGGGTRLESTPGRGSCFQVTLKLARAAARGKIPTPDILRGKRALLLDTHKLSRSCIRSQLEYCGMEVRAVETPEQLQAPDSGDADLILLGFTGGDYRSGLAEKTVAAVRSGSTRPVLALMDVSEQSALRRIQLAGADRCHSKPLTLRGLAQTLGALFENPDSDPTQTPSRGATALASPSFTGRHFLIVEDNPINRELVSTLLTGKGAQITHAANGREAVELARTHRYDLIIMDVHMPEMSGLEATQQIRNDELPGQHTPIVALTADAAPQQREQIFMAGMDDCMTKPFNETRLCSLIGRLLDEWSSPSPAPSPPGPAGAAATEPAAAGEAEKETDGAILPARDSAQAVRIAGGAAELAEHMFMQLLEELPRQFELMQRQAMEKDWEGLWNTAHRMHGATAVCGVPALDRAVALLENEIKAKSPERIQARLAQAGAEMERLLRHQERGASTPR